MMQPKRTKYRKQFKGRNAGLAQRGSTCRVRRLRPEGDEPRAHDCARDRSGPSRHDALREARRPGVDPRVPGRAGHARSRSKSAWARGKGNVEYYVARVQPGKVLFEMEGVTEEIAREAFRLAASQALGRHDVRQATGALMKAKELRGQEHGAELQEELLKLRREQFNLRMAQATGQAAKSDQFGKVRRNIARVKTVLGEQPRRRANRGSK